MMAVFFQEHLTTDDSLFPDVAPLLLTAAPADIQALPSLQNNPNVYGAQSGSNLSNRF